MFTLREKIALGIAGVEFLLLCVAGHNIKKVIDKRFEEQHGMTIKEYDDATKEKVRVIK